jgi:hypothetical protein
VRIPLDYYRILGLPIQATTEQLQQAHRDRTLQLPRREFSEAAIDARKQLLDEAYAVLSDPAKRQEYDTSFLAKSYELLESRPGADFPDQGLPTMGRDGASQPLDPYTTSIDIQEQQFIGALPILLEMGEYELVLKLGRPYLQGGHHYPQLQNLGNPAIVESDIVLTVALACLELGREQWQQGQYEGAAESLQIGQNLLLQSNLFAHIRGEMASDLFKLRPYRILELLALPEQHKAEREQGLKLLGEMLEERGGIDGNGDDQSGLSMDDFLRFIQQLRTYMTSAEQHALFERESRRPSAVATYLAVYSLLARGFAQRQPGLVRRAKQMLTRLGNRQDVHLEQAVCALLLGQTEEASRALELSQEFESIAFIRDHSHGSPDLLPGLCLYSERWLQNEVFPHFLDLARKQASLKEYFADEDVQAYLEELPAEPEGSAQWSSSYASTYRSGISQRSVVAEPQIQALGQERTTTDYSGYSSNGNSSTALVEPPELVSDAAYGADDAYTARGATRADQDEMVRTGRSPRETARSRGDRNRPPSNPVHYVAAGEAPVRRTRGGRSPRLDRLLLLAGLGVLVTALLIFLATRIFGSRATQPSVAANSSGVTGGATTSPSPNATASPNATTGNTTTGNTATATASPAAGTATPQLKSLKVALGGLLAQQPAIAEAPAGALTADSAQGLIQQWLKVKSLAMGETHAADQLETVLTGSALADWQSWAQQEKIANTHVKYEHASVTVNSVEIDPNDPEQTIVEALVSEKKEAFADGKPEGTGAIAQNLQIRYTLVQQDGKWRIKLIEAQ